MSAHTVQSYRVINAVILPMDSGIEPASKGFQFRFLHHKRTRKVSFTEDDML